MKEALSDGSRQEGVVFQDFLKLMQLFREFQDGQRLHKEQQAVQATAFSGSEVAQFRDLFILAANASHESSLPAELSFDQFRNMIHDITPLGDALTADLKDIFAKFTRRISGEVRSKRSFEDADFPEFLLMMKHLLDINFANIKEKTHKPVKAPPAKAARSAGPPKEPKAPAS
ncbi:unnamed protein product [Symbiodinium natans]|uniref:Uncharacterized protein n=1 Tax=Symbiodinium natans TaxID=878477 RepID=A0A812SVK0_9DINO|nr:unnamed protein product [Symbiodinium natans]